MKNLIESGKSPKAIVSSLTSDIIPKELANELSKKLGSEFSVKTNKSFGHKDDGVVIYKEDEAKWIQYNVGADHPYLGHDEKSGGAREMKPIWDKDDLDSLVKDLVKKAKENL